MKLKSYFKTLKYASKYYFINSIAALVASVTASYLSKLDSDHVFSFLLLKLFLFPVVGSRSEMAWFWPVCKERYKTQAEVCHWLWRTLPGACTELSSPFPSVNKESWSPGPSSLLAQGSSFEKVGAVGQKAWKKKRKPGSHPTQLRSGSHQHGTSGTFDLQGRSPGLFLTIQGRYS